MDLRRVAANYVVMGERRMINHIVEIMGSRVVNYYPLEGEIALTEWLGGTIEIREGKAYRIIGGKDGSPSREELLTQEENCC